jgi:uncharacterized protein (DUF433 family)
MSSSQTKRSLHTQIRKIANGCFVPNLYFMNLERITLDPAVMSGKPCIRGLRVTVANVLRQLANQRTVPQILEAYPYLESADIDACLVYAALRVDDEELVLSAA